MLRWTLLVVAFALLALGSLTVFKTPDWVPWRLGVAAGEFGHWLAVAMLTLALFAWFARAGAGMWAVATCGSALVASVLFLKPTWQAWRVAGDLPAQLTAQFGASAMTRPAFSVRGFFENDAAPVAIETMEVVPGLPPASEVERATGRSGRALRRGGMS